MRRTLIPPRLPRRLQAISFADWLALAGFLLLVVFYFSRLTVWLIGDDEGSYLYAAWRISLGELPYRDFLTPQLPAFLLPGGLLMKLVGPSVWAARALATSATLVAGAATWATARRLFGAWVGLLAGAALLLQPDVYLYCRTFRADPFMLGFAALGVYCFVRGVLTQLREAERASEPVETVDTATSNPSGSARLGADNAILPTSPSLASARPDHRWLIASGVCFGLATLSKLFGPMPLAGCLAWWLADAWRNGGRPSRLEQRARLLAVLRSAWVPVAACAAVVAIGMGAFALMSSAVFDATVGHHLRQGAGTAPLEVLHKGVAFYLVYLRQNSNALLVCVAVAVAGLAWTATDRRRLLFGWQLPTALVFLILTRDAYERHLIYLIPALATLWAVGMCELARRGQRALAVALVVALFAPWWLLDRDHGWRWEVGTPRLADFIQLVTAPDDLVFSDYSELNFYGKRPTTYSGASLSSGAAKSGQITWARIAGELGESVPPLLVIDTDPIYAHLHFLQDGDAYRAWRDAHYGAPVGRFVRSTQAYDIYRPKDRPLPELATFADGPTLLAASLLQDAAASGADVQLRAAWRTSSTLAANLSMTARLLDGDGTQWAQSDSALLASDGQDELQVRPTSAWLPLEITTDRLSLHIPLGTPPDEYIVTLGLYRSADLVSLDVTGGTGIALGQEVQVGKLVVRPWLAGGSDTRAFPLAVRFGGQGLDARPPERRTGPPQIALLGRGPLPTTTLQAGTVLPFELLWRAGGSENHAVRLVLTDDSGRTAAGHTFPLGIGTPASAWPAEDLIVRQLVALPVDAKAPTGTYHLRVAADVDMAAATDAETAGQGIDAHAADWLDLGTVQIEARDLTGLIMEPPPLERTLDASVGGVGELLGWVRGSLASNTASANALAPVITTTIGSWITATLAPSATVAAGAPIPIHPGEPLTLTLVWRALAPTPIGYKVTLQLVDAADKPIAQHDGEPGDWQRPTTGWIPGEIITDTHTIQIPPDLPAGQYGLVAGLYHPGTGRRLAVTGRDAGGEGLVRVGGASVISVTD